MKKISVATLLCGLAASLSAEMVITERNITDDAITFTLTESVGNNYAVTGASLMLGDNTARNASGVGVAVADSVATITLMFPATADSLYDGLRVKTMKGPIDLKIEK